MEAFQFPRADPENARLEELSDLIAFTMLGNTQRGMLRKLAEPGEPLDLIVRGLLAYSDQARYAISRFDLEDPEQLAKAIAAGRERKAIDWTVRLLERLLTPVPTAADDGDPS